MSSSCRRRRQVVDAMLKLAGVTAKDVVYDLGCGDGMIVTAAAQELRRPRRRHRHQPAAREGSQRARHRRRASADKVKILQRGSLQGRHQRGDGRHALPAAVAQREADPEAQQRTEAGHADRVAELHDGRQISSRRRRSKSTATVGLSVDGSDERKEVTTAANVASDEG